MAGHCSLIRGKSWMMANRIRQVYPAKIRRKRPPSQPIPREKELSVPPASNFFHTANVYFSRDYAVLPKKMGQES
jgi:hypothetical protein